MNNITQVVNLVEDKLKLLLENYRFLKEENELLLQKVTLLEHQIAKEKQQFEQIEKNYQSLKIAKTIEGSNDNTRDTKLKINELIREIDVCITQLSE